MDPYYGSVKCEDSYKNGNPCRYNVYYKVKEDPIYRCGMHSKNIERVQLVKDPNAKKNKQKLIETRKREAQDAKCDGKGDVRCAKMKMMKKDPYTKGYLNVFPNFKHQNRSVFGCSSLSPKSLGPVIHGQPGLPDSLNLENFHQFNKVFSSEVDEKGNPTSIFFETQIEGYTDKIPHRHKETALKKNVPQYWLWKMKDRSYKRFGYVESRQFYSKYYQQLSKDLPDLKKLKDMIEEGWNLQLCGYDSINDLTAENAEQYYLDPTQPFGHESVLFCLLVLPEDKWPWLLHQTEDF